MSTCRPRRTNSCQHTLIVISLIAALTACAAGQDQTPSAKLVDPKPMVAKGEFVSKMPKDLMYVFQAKDGRYWFSSGSEGAFCYDGKTITRFTKKDGLAGDSVAGVQEDESGNLYFNTNGGISKFDGQSFATLEPIATGQWMNQPDDLWFGGGQDSEVVYRYDGQSLHRLAFPKTKAGDDATLPRDKFPNAKYSPYDVYSIFKDSKGDLWFGTAVLGVCRYDGKFFTWIPEEELQNGSFGTRSIIEDKDGKFWFSNTSHRYAVETNATSDAPWYRKEKGIGDLSGIKAENYESFMSSVIGNDGAIWMAILGGAVYRYDGHSITPYHIKQDGKHHWIFSIYKDRQGDFWIGTHAHGVYRFNGMSFERFEPTPDVKRTANAYDSAIDSFALGTSISETNDAVLLIETAGVDAFSALIARLDDESDACDRLLGDVAFIGEGPHKPHHPSIGEACFQILQSQIEGVWPKVFREFHVLTRSNIREWLEQRKSSTLNELQVECAKMSLDSAQRKHEQNPTEWTKTCVEFLSKNLARVQTQH